MNQKERAELLSGIMREMLQKIGADDFFGQELEEIIAFRTILTEETDRGCALMSSSLLEHRLGQLLKSYIVDDKKIHKELFEGNGPFTTFSSRINTAFALGLISKTMMHDLNILRKIRNEFAHNPTNINFKTNRIADQCKALNYAGENTANIEPRECFIRTMLGIDGTITTEMRLIKNKLAKKDEDRSAREDMFEFLKNKFKELPF